MLVFSTVIHIERCTSNSDDTYALIAPPWATTAIR